MTKQPPRVPSADPPVCQCSTCYYYHPQEIDHGVCYGFPPAAILAEDGEIMFPRLVVMEDDQGCVYWKARHRA